MDIDQNWWSRSTAQSNGTVFCGLASQINSNRTNNMTWSRPKLSSMEKEMIENSIDSMRQRIDQIQQLPDVEDERTDVKSTDVYKKFDFDTASSKHLPIYSSKKDILEAIERHYATIIVGNTGCGKTTQVPQIILDDARLKNKPCNIIITQPRRIAARQAATEVSRERGWILGSIVGYQVGLDKRYLSEQTRITYCTTGVLLEKLIAIKSLDTFSHIILDEVHDRDSDMDFLFVIIRILMNRSPHVKLILMSATIDTRKFAEYFKTSVDVPAPVVHVVQKNKYRVKIKYVDEIIKYDSNLANLKWDKPSIPDVLYDFVPEFIQAQTSRESTDENGNPLASILIFLPGIYEIGRMHTALTKFQNGQETELNWNIVILHSMISSEEQQSIFRPVEKGYRIILATNIAESSITVDVRCVFDFCLTKYLQVNPSKNFTSLVLDYCSKQSARQRSGRAGRLGNGICFRMIPQRIYNCYLKDYGTPEILMAPLENIILKIKQFDVGRIHIVLGLAMDPPKMEDVVSSVISLKELGSLLPTCDDDDLSVVDGTITPIGRIQAGLPIDVRASKLIALGYCFSVLEESIIMAAVLTVKSIFKLYFHKNLNAYTRQMEWSNGSGSDLFAKYNAFRVWTMKYNENTFGKRQDQKSAEKEFCFKHNLDVRSLHECLQLIKELKYRLEKLGIREMIGENRAQLSDKEKAIILKVVVSGAFYPNYFASYATNDLVVQRRIFNDLNGRDPNKTIYFSGFRPSHIRELYVDSIKKLFEQHVVDKNHLDHIQVSFDQGSEKTFVTFNMDVCDRGDGKDWDTSLCSIPGRVLPEVYKAIKMRQLRIPTEIHILPEEYELYLATKSGIGTMNGSHFVYKKNYADENIQLVCVPGPTVEEIKGIVTHVVNCSKFWLQPSDQKSKVDWYNETLNAPNCPYIEMCFDDDIIDKNAIMVARNRLNNRLYRARVLNWYKDKSEVQCEVLFIDFGCVQKDCVKDDLYTFKGYFEAAKMPPRCFECCLAEIQPSASNLSGGSKWDYQAVEKFKRMVLGKEVTAKIYSVVNASVNVSITCNEMEMNSFLIENMYGDFCEESYWSKENHLKRLEHQENLKYVDADDSSSFSALNLDYIEYHSPAEPKSVIIPQDKIDRNNPVRLIGPKTPLESSMVACLNREKTKSVSIDHSSVNSVFLASTQQQSSIRYMVAANVNQSNSIDAGIVVNETTLLPDIPGFGPLMAMIFARQIDLKLDDTKSRYVSLLTGLGLSEIRQPLFPEHDALFHLDFVLDNDDISNINKIRYSVNTLLHHTQEKCEANVTLVKIELMQKLKTVILELLMKHRKPKEIRDDPHEWNTSPDTHYKPPLFDSDGDILPPHGIWQLQSISNDTLKMLRQHCTDLHKMTFQFTRQIVCKLCTAKIESAKMLRIHLMNNLHKEREKEIGFL